MNQRKNTHIHTQTTDKIMKERYFKSAVFMQRQLLDRRYKVLKSQEPTPQRCRFLPHSVRWGGGGEEAS